jgi:hypothetical protein
MIERLTSKQLAQRWNMKLQTIYNMRSLSNNYDFPHPHYFIEKKRIFYKLSEIIKFEQKKQNNYK